MTQETYTDKINSQSSPERKKYRINFKKMGAFVLALSIGVSGVAYGIHNAFDKVSDYMDENGIKVSDVLNLSEHQFDPNKLSDELISVSVKEGDNIENLIESNMAYDKEKGIDMRRVILYVKHLPENRDLFRVVEADGVNGVDGVERTIKPGDIIHLYASYDETDESPDK